MTCFRHSIFMVAENNELKNLDFETMQDTSYLLKILLFSYTFMRPMAIHYPSILGFSFVFLLYPVTSLMSNY